VQGIVRGLSVTPSWWSRHGDKVLVAGFAAAVGVSVWGRFRYDRRVREEWARASRALQILEQRQGLAQESLRLGGEVLGTNFTCFTSTRVQILTQEALLGGRQCRVCLKNLQMNSVDLLYWYKSENTDAEGGTRRQALAKMPRGLPKLAYPLYLVYKYKNTNSDTWSVLGGWPCPLCLEDFQLTLYKF